MNNNENDYADGQNKKSYLFAYSFAAEVMANYDFETKYICNLKDKYMKKKNVIIIDCAEDWVVN